jgi:hypothetical protein
MSSVTETINAGTWREFFEPGDFFRLLETTAPVTVEFYAAGRKIVDVVNIQAGYAEYFRGGTLVMFDRVRIYSATTQQVGFVTRFGSDVRYDRGASSVTGTVALDAATLAALGGIKADQSYANNAVVGAATSINLVTPAANLQGLWVTEASIVSYNSGASHACSLLAKNSAPANTADGQVILHSSAAMSAINPTTLNKNVWVPPGLGLYFYNVLADTAGHNGIMRSCRWKLA